MQDYRNIVNLFLKKHMPEYVVLLISLFLSEFGLMYILNKISFLIDDAISGRMLRIHLIHQITPVFFLPVFLLFRFLFKHMDFLLSNKGMIYLESCLLDKLLHKDYEAIMKHNKIEIAQRINNDSVIIMDFIVSQRPVLGVNFLKLALILLLIGFQSMASSITLLCLTFIFVIVYTGTRKYYEGLNKKMTEAQYTYFGVLGGELLNVFLVKINCWYNRTIERFLCSGRRFVKESVRFLDFDYFINNTTKIMSVISLLLLPLIVIYTSVNSVGSILLIVTFTQLYFPILESVIEQFKIYSCFKVAEKRMIDLLNLTEEHGGNLQPVEIQEITLRNISFHYQSDNKIIFKHFYYKFKTNNIYFIMGANGSGKSTLLNIILGILMPTDGTIIFNDTRLQQYNIDQMREKKISYCEQEPYLIDGTIRENIITGSYCDEEILIGNPLLEFVQELTYGMETPILSEVNNLSGGQKQRIAISRCFAKRTADILIFDEPTSALDKEGVGDFIQMLKRYKKDKIIIIVTHDKEIMQIADDIIHMS